MGRLPPHTYDVAKASSNARRMMKPPKTRPAVLRCCGWHKNVFSWRV